MPAIRKSRSKIRTSPAGTANTGVSPVNRAGSVGLERGELVGEPGPEVGRQVGPDADPVAFAVLLIGRVKLDEGKGAVEPELGDGQARQLALPQPGEHKRLVDQGPLPADGF